MFQHEQIFYNKKIQYGNYIKNIVFPLDYINSLPRGCGGNRGVNDFKLRHNMVRSKGMLIRKAIHNFSTEKTVSFVTLTYRQNMTDLKRAKRHINQFFKKFRAHWYNPIREKYFSKKPELKYLYVYEYQKRGAIHFHIIFNNKISWRYVSMFWKHCLPIGIDCSWIVNDSSRVVKYLAKYVTKAFSEDNKSLNNQDFGFRAFNFSRNCKNPIISKSQFSEKLVEIPFRLLGIENFKFFKSKPYNDNRDTFLLGFTCDSLIVHDPFPHSQSQQYVDLQLARDRVMLKVAFKTMISRIIKRNLQPKLRQFEHMSKNSHKFDLDTLDKFLRDNHILSKLQKIE